MNSHLYWHAFAINTPVGLMTIIAGESTQAQIDLPFVAPVPFSDPSTEVEWTYLGTFNHQPNDLEKALAEQGAGFDVEVPVYRENAIQVYDVDDWEDLMDMLDEAEWAHEADCS